MWLGNKDSKHLDFQISSGHLRTGAFWNLPKVLIDVPYTYTAQPFGGHT